MIELSYFNVIIIGIVLVSTGFLWYKYSSDKISDAHKQGKLIGIQETERKWCKALASNQSLKEIMNVNIDEFLSDIDLWENPNV